MGIRSICFGIWMAVAGVFICGTGAVYGQGQHTYYLQALGDLTMARSLLLQHVDGKPMSHNEKEALRQINVVIADINKANPTSNDVAQSKLPESSYTASYLEQCIAYLKKAKAAISHEEDSKFGGGLRDRSESNCAAAMRFVEQEGGR